MQRVHRAKWNSGSAKKQRAAEQAVRDEMKQEAVATYHTFKDLDLQIVVDLNSFTVTELSEPVEIILTDTGSQSVSSTGQKSVLVAPNPHSRTKLKTTSSQHSVQLNALLLNLRESRLNHRRKVFLNALPYW